MTYINSIIHQIKKNKLQFSEIIFFALLYLLCSNYIQFGHYVDDIKWVLLSENFLKFTANAQWSVFPAMESINWGVSIIILPVIAVIGKAIIFLKVYMTILLFIGIIVFYAISSQTFTKNNKYLYLILLFFNGFILSFAGAVISETVYIFLFGLTVYILFSNNLFDNFDTRTSVLIGLITSLMILTRTMSIIFLIAVILELIIRKKWKSIVFYCMFTLIGIMPYFVLSKFSQGEMGFYGKYWMLWFDLDIKTIMFSMINNLYYYIKGLSCLTFINMPNLFSKSVIAKILGIIFSVTMVLLGLKKWRENSFNRFMSIYFILYILVYSIWTYMAPRYIQPIFPVFIYLWITGVLSIKNIFTRKIIIIATIFLTVISNYPEIASTLTVSLSNSKSVSHQSYNWLKNNTKNDDLVISMDIARIYYFTGIKGMAFVPSNNLSEFINNSKKLNVRYFVLKKAGYTDSADNVNDPILGQFKIFVSYLSRDDIFKKVYENKKEFVRIYELK